MSVKKTNHAAKILIVDDEQDNLTISSEHLFAEGYKNITTTREPLEAVSLFEQRSFDLVLLDIMMPEYDGFYVMESMRAVRPKKKCPILVLTARQDEGTRLRALREGAQDFLSKPFLEEELLSRVRNLLDAHMAQKYLRRMNGKLDAMVSTRTTQLEEMNRQLWESQTDVLKRLAFVAECRDNETGLHVIRMSHYAKIIGKHLELTEKEGELILLSAPMHDIGKIGIPDAILLKPGKLDPDEWQVMMQPAIPAIP